MLRHLRGSRRLLRRGASLEWLLLLRLLLRLLERLSLLTWIARELRLLRLRIVLLWLSRKTCELLLQWSLSEPSRLRAQPSLKASGLLE